MAKLGKGKRTAFALVPLLLILLATEGFVRVTGLAESCPSQFPINHLICDPILEYKVNPKWKPVEKWLNREGFRTHEFTDKDPNVFRIVTLGDSCTFGRIHKVISDFIYDPYPERLERIIAERDAPGKVEVLNAGMPAYNSYQGVMLLRTKLRGLEPDLITVRYGWNDHYMSSDNIGVDAFHEPESRIARAFQGLLLRTALYPFARRLGLELQALRKPVPNQAQAAFRLQKEWRPSIPLADYEHNLRRIVEIGRGRGAEVWLLTAPHNPAPGAESAQRETFINRMSIERLIEIHDIYNDATRRIGAELGAPVVDMDALYREHPDAGAFFLPTDFPHPAQAGHDFESEVLFDRLVATGVVRRRQSNEPDATRATAP